MAEIENYFIAFWLRGDDALIKRSLIRTHAVIVCSGALPRPKVCIRRSLASHRVPNRGYILRIQWKLYMWNIVTVPRPYKVFAGFVYIVRGAYVTLRLHIDRSLAAVRANIESYVREIINFRPVPEIFPARGGASLRDSSEKHPHRRGEIPP